MSLRVGINGFGRIGRNVLRCAFAHPDLEIVAINDLGDASTLAHLLKYDSVHGQFNHTVEAKDDCLLIDGKSIRMTHETSPAYLPWREMAVDLVVESTGRFVDRPSAQQHLEAGAKKVIISAPAKNPDVTVVLGVNESQYDAKSHDIISNASCTTNCLAPVAKVLDEHFGIQSGLMTTVHSYTRDQQLLDGSHKDLRRARTAGQSIIPTTTGAAKAISEVLPSLTGKLDGMSIRVPTPNVSVVDLVVMLNRDADITEIQAVFKNAAENELKGILAYTEVPLVSIDFKGNTHSSIVDGPLTSVINKRMAKVVSWYDNEWGYSCRVRDLVLYVGKSL
ncbi:NAD-dependent glyceraldehyde-3-phosphate dehydrogenase [hydrothermal vent metagenome]|uniref:NAD-dependent glyceraldehyde-3-phosphate dehydrogenase n=1 Tax=hydrothermal vent metagenome TaxID=652676 RepID=A0A3B1DAS9_9ZZZZ